MQKAVIGSEGYLKQCCICYGYIENEMYEIIQSRRSAKKRYYHVKCYTPTKIKHRKEVK